MKIGEKQELFAKLIAEHILWLYEQGYKIRIGDVFRDPRAFGAVGESGPYGSKYSMHKDKCAADLNLFKDGEYLTSTEDHLASGRMWESRHPLCCWGGRFDDGNHYSITHEGRK
jgi:hypothetical protein